MCTALDINDTAIRPGWSIAYWLKQNSAERSVWAGFARRESIGWWKKQGGVLVDIPAKRFAERSDVDGHLTWDDVPTGQVVRGVIDPNEGKPLLKVVTRASTPDELAKYEHDRMPLIEPPLFSAEDTGLPFEQPKPRAPRAKAVQEGPTGAVQGELF